MPKYNETSIIGESWKRAFQILIENRYGQNPKIRFSEEEVFVAADGRLAGTYYGEGVEEHFTAENALTQFQLRNPETEEYIDQYASYRDLHVLLHSLYFHLARIRDRGPKPYLSWIVDETTNTWQAPVPMPLDDQHYTWNENTISWDVIPQPYPSWTFDENSQQWQAPVPMPLDGQTYIWNESTLSWELDIGE